ncbi:MAG TPA: hypothetical protein VHO24_02525 [Opitutaceae bacterium]|nr:hypothetical protein [Opitutaceae bacterium]
MLSLLKKKSEANVPLVPAWHPNFRNFERLPDTKVVRTAFFINVFAITVTLVLLLYVVRKEWDLHTVRVQIADKEQQINRDKPGSDQAVALFKQFQGEEAKVAEVDAFVKSKTAVSTLLIHLGETLPKNIAIDRFDLGKDGLALSATVRGAPDQASGQATAYIEQLRADKELAPLFDDITPTSSGRNPQNGRIMIQLFLRFKGVVGKDGKK